MENTENIFTVVVHERPAVKVGKFLVMEGYDLADANGCHIDISYLFAGDGMSDAIGILYDNPKKRSNTKKGFLGNLFKPKYRRDFIGVIWFQNKARKSDDTNWYIELHGQENLQLMVQLAENLKDKFKVNINIVPKQNFSSTERLPCDYTDDGF